MEHVVRTNGRGVLGVVSGTTSRSGLQIQALALDPRFDFSHAYWMLAGIAGVDRWPTPRLGVRRGRVTWWMATLLYEIDVAAKRRRNWPYGIMVIGAKEPNVMPPPQGWEPDKMSFALNPALVERAFALTKNVA